MKSDMMTYKGYRASISYDKEDNIFVGEVFGVSDFLSFHGESVSQLETAFCDCIENYLEICKKINKEPQKAFSGSFNVRTSPKVHEKAAKYAVENGCSLNQVVSMAVEEFLKHA